MHDWKICPKTARLAAGGHPDVFVAMWDEYLARLRHHHQAGCPADSRESARDDQAQSECSQLPCRANRN